MEKLSTLISGFCSCIKSVSLINNSRWLKAEGKISGFLKSTKWSGCEYKCLTTSVVWWLNFKGLGSSSRNFNSFVFDQYRNYNNNIYVCIPHYIVPDVLVCPYIWNDLRSYVFYEWESVEQVLSDIFEKSFAILFLVVLTFHQGKACKEEFFEYQSSFLACFFWRSVFITFVEKYFDLFVCKPVRVSITTKTGFNMLKFFVDHLVWAANLVGTM